MVLGGVGAELGGGFLALGFCRHVCEQLQDGAPHPL